MRKDFTHKAINRALSLRMRHSNVNISYVSDSLIENRTRTLKLLSNLEKKASC